LSLRHELRQRKRANTLKATNTGDVYSRPREETARPRATTNHCPAPFGADVETQQVITVVSGLPRSGTSMMMQLLAAAGRETLSDAKRPADEDNPLGYFEFEQTLNLSKDSSWLPQARGKTVKIVAQLLPLLPRNEHYQIIFMERNLAEVV